MDALTQIILAIAGLIFLIGFLRIFSIDSSLRQILELLKKHYEDKKP